MNKSVKLRPGVTVSYDMSDVAKDQCSIRKREEAEALLRRYPPSPMWIKILDGRNSDRSKRTGPTEGTI
jgi:hypothetical protein